jgi:hypothetical protein
MRFERFPLLLVSALVMACSIDQPATAPVLDPSSPIQGTTSHRPVTGFRTSGEVRSGWVLGRDGQPMAIRYEVHDGRAIWQGDIDLGPASGISVTVAGAKPYLRMGGDVSARVGGGVRGVIPNDLGFRWPGGVVPFEADPDLPAKDRITKAIEMIESTTGGVRIVPRNGEADYVKFVPDSDGCSSEIGRRGGEQIIKLTFDCKEGSTAHELLHAIGITHEQNRCDRDNFVEIQFDHIEDDKKHNFEIACDGWTDVGTYDFGSIMHYGLDAFSKDGQPTIKLRPGISYSGVIGQTSALGASDRITVNHMYGLFNQAPVAKICAPATDYFEGSAAALDGTCSTDADDKLLTYDWNFGDGVCAGDDGLQCILSKTQHTYASDGVYKLGLVVHDGYTIGSTEAFITVKNVAPAFTMPTSTFPTDEGSVFRGFISFSDPGNDVTGASVTYGDGSAAMVPETIGENVFLDHIYADNGPAGQKFTVSLSISDDDETTTKTIQHEVRNVTPTVVAGDDIVLESGQSFNLLASFTDPGVFDSPWQWSVDWGTGLPSTGSTNAQGNITGSRQLCASGDYTVTVSVTDKDGGTGTDAVKVSVGFVTVGTDIAPGGVPNAVSLKKKGSLPVAMLSTATFDATAIDVSSVRLGDGTGNDTPAETQRGKYVTRVEDVNKDGRMDLVVSFNVADLIASGDLNGSTTSLVIRGFQGTGSCVNFRGTDAVVVVSS